MFQIDNKLNIFFTKLSEWPNSEHKQSWRKNRECFFTLTDLCWLDGRVLHLCEDDATNNLIAEESFERQRFFVR
jgi:hypothetical protein